MTKKNIVILSLIVVFGCMLRFLWTDRIPPGLNRDEASIGYTAYSLLKTGRDEYGKLLPLSFESFGDWKLPLYIYLDTIPVFLFSLNEFSVRLPSILLGVATLVVTYFFTRVLFRNGPRAIPIVSALFLAVSPWHIHFSRVASEANVAVFLVAFGLLLFWMGFHKRFFLPLSGIVLSLSLYTYHGNHVFTPLLVLGLVGILIYKKQRKSLLLFLIPLCILAFFIYSLTLLGADRTKVAGLTPLTDMSLLYENVSVPRVEHGGFLFIPGNLFHNKIIFASDLFLRGYLRSFSPEFLVIRGGGNWQHNIPEFGNLFVWELPFVLFGIYTLFAKKMPWRWFLLYWLLISPIPAAITKDAPHSARMLSVLPLPHILSAIGIVELFRVLPRRIAMVGLIAAFLLSFNFVQYLDRYIVHFPLLSESSWGGGYKQLVSEISQKKDTYREIVMDRPDYSPYIYFLFFEKIDPAVFQESVERYEKDREGFHHVKGLGKLQFKKLDWSDDLIVPDRLIVAWAESMPSSATNSAVIIDDVVLARLQKNFGQTFGLTYEDIVETHVKDIIYLKNKKPQFYLIEVKKAL